MKTILEENRIIIYNTADGKTAVYLFAKDGMVRMNQNQLDTDKKKYCISQM